MWASAQPMFRWLRLLVGSAAGSSKWTYPLRSGVCPACRRARRTASALLEVAMLSDFQEKCLYTMTRSRRQGTMSHSGHACLGSEMCYRRPSGTFRIGQQPCVFQNTLPTSTVPFCDMVFQQRTHEESNRSHVGTVPLGLLCDRLPDSQRGSNRKWLRSCNGSISRAPKYQGSRLFNRQAKLAIVF